MTELPKDGQIPANLRRRIFWLALSHVTTGLTVWRLNAWGDRSVPNLTLDVLLGILFSQAGLLGIWAGLGTSSWWKRLFGAVAGIGYLGLLFCFGLDEPDRVGLYVALLVETVLIASVVLSARCFRLRIILVGADETAAPPMQFSIRQLLFLTFAVACMLSLGKYLEPNSTLPQGVLLVLVLFGLLAAILGLLSVWPVLGARAPVVPILMMIIAATGLGACFGWLCPFYGDTAYFWVSMLFAFVEAVSLVASLLVVRSGGYRLMRLPPRRVAVENAANPPQPSPLP
jgi:hypothetical protein